MRVILYLRVSTDEQSADMQRAALTSHCDYHRWPIVEICEEIESGGKVDRPVRASIIQRASRRNRGFDAVVVWKLDRWGRSSGDLITGLDALTQQGIGFVSVTESFDLTTPAGRAMAGMLAVFAQFERETIRERVNAGIRRYREKHPGKWGRPATARQFAGLVLSLKEEGKSVSAIAKKAQMSESSVRRILKGASA